MVKQTANMEIKSRNRTSIYQYLRSNPGQTRQDLVRSLQLCLPTVTQNLTQLQQEGLVEESGSMGNTGGRKAKLYGIVAAARAAVGLDITRHRVTAVVVDLNGTILAGNQLKTDFARNDAYYQALGRLVEQSVADSGVSPDRILGVGMGVPGLVTGDHQGVFYGEILGFTGADSAELSRYNPYPTTLHNDANAAGFAEAWAVPEPGNAYYLMLSNNLGGSVVVDGRVYAGDHLRSGEVGHMCIVPGGRPCYCGQKGCVDAYLAATELSDMTDGSLELFFDLLRGGSQMAREKWDRYVEHLAFAVNNLSMLFDCRVILGGYVGQYIGPYLDDIRRRAGQLNPFEHSADYLTPCACRREAIATGAALNYISDFLAQI